MKHVAAQTPAPRQREKMRLHAGARAHVRNGERARDRARGLILCAFFGPVSALYTPFFPCPPTHSL